MRRLEVEQQNSQAKLSASDGFRWVGYGVSFFRLKGSRDIWKVVCLAYYRATKRLLQDVERGKNPNHSG